MARPILLVVCLFGVSVLLLYLGLPVVGLLSFSLLHETYTALLHQGASLNGCLLHTATNDAADDQHFLMLCTRTPRRYTIDSPLKPRILGSAAYHIAAVASGSALAGIESTPKLWDLAAALLILTEAGGCYRCLEQQQPIFPLAPTTKDYQQTSYALLAAANISIMDELHTQITRRSQ
jgi:myo-inositol-1(or 4)-monophosphatase